jgi:hypothetical protein
MPESATPGPIDFSRYAHQQHALDIDIPRLRAFQEQMMALDDPELMDLSRAIALFREWGETASPEQGVATILAAVPGHQGLSVPAIDAIIEIFREATMNLGLVQGLLFGRITASEAPDDGGPRTYQLTQRGRDDYDAYEQQAIEEAK